MTGKDKRELENFFKKNWEAPYDKVDGDHIDESWDIFSRKLNTGKPHRNAMARYGRIASLLAASVVLFFGFGLFFMDNTENLVLINTNNEPLRTVLEDSTIVALAPGSKLEYPIGFGDAFRKVSLEGEAFFEVTEDRTRPFHVIAGKTTTTVLGTSFNVIWDNATDNARISLFTGAVEVKVGGSNEVWSISPGEEFRFSEGSTKIGKFNKELVAAWHLPSFRFRDTPLPEVLEVLEKRYNVVITYKGNLKDNRMTLGIHQGDSLQKILKIISLTHKLKITKNHKNGEITLNK